jgi:pimeloyl-ACP methyl ester carboxylesterase
MTTVAVPFDASSMAGDLTIPVRPAGVIVFAHGSGSSRHSPRNQFVARELNKAGFATLLIDLLTPGEETIDETTREFRFDIAMLADRLAAILDWLPKQRVLSALPVGLFGASTGAGAALVAAAKRPGRVAAVVSRGGRPDLAGDSLAHVVAPTLLIVGGHDETVIELNEQARQRMPGVVSLMIVPGATHLFEESGALQTVAKAAAGWFERYLPVPK